MPDIDYRSLSCSVQIFFAVSCGDPATFTTHSNGIFFFEIARKERWMIRHGVPILAERATPNGQCQSCLAEPRNVTAQWLQFKLS
jgi:hypothetical protein